MPQKINSKANAIRKFNLSENQKEDIGMKEEMIKILKKWTGYKKDEEMKEFRRKRRAKIRAAAELDEYPGEYKDKINLIKDNIYSKEEKLLNSCPFPNHEGYLKVWQKLSPDEQQKMKENFRITDDGKIEIIKLWDIVLKKINHEYKGKRIGLPKIGCGLANGDWNVVKKIIEDRLKDCDVTIVNYNKKGLW